MKNLTLFHYKSHAKVFFLREAQVWQVESGKE